MQGLKAVGREYTEEHIQELLAKANGHDVAVKVASADGTGTLVNL